MLLLSIACGMVVGLSLGLTGGGGSIFAIPLLVYVLGVAPREAVGVSLAAVGATAAVGFVQRWYRGEVEVFTGLLFAVAGMLGAPLGAWLGRYVPESALLLGFAGLMGLVAVRMWRKARSRPEEALAVRAAVGSPDEPGPTCRRDPEGKLRLTSRCASLLVVVGALTGVLSGLFGVGGGFVIVPALVFFSGMGIHRAVATSLMVITLISASGVGSVLALTATSASGSPFPWALTGTFVAGGVLGMGLGTALARRLAGPRLQQLFAIAILCVAAFIVIKHFSGI